MALTSVDLYCERSGPGLLAEPVNAATNAAFFIAAWALWRFARRSGEVSPGTWVLLALVAAIGAGSTLFHTFAAPWAHVLDIAPILLFQLAFLWCYGREIMGLRPASAAGLVAAFFAAALYARGFPQILDGSLTYAPALLAVLALGVYHFERRKAGQFDLLAAAALLAVSLVFRTVDMAVCASFSLGTHFMWHLLNAVVLYLCTRGLLLNSRSPRGGGA